MFRAGCFSFSLRFYLSFFPFTIRRRKAFRFLTKWFKRLHSRSRIRDLCADDVILFFFPSSTLQGLLNDHRVHCILFNHKILPSGFTFDKNKITYSSTYLFPESAVKLVSSYCRFYPFWHMFSLCRQIILSMIINKTVDGSQCINNTIMMIDIVSCNILKLKYLNDFYARYDVTLPVINYHWRIT